MGKSLGRDVNDHLCDILLGIEFMYIEKFDKKPKKIQGDFILCTHCSEFLKFQRFVSF